MALLLLTLRQLEKLHKKLQYYYKQWFAVNVGRYDSDLLQSNIPASVTRNPSQYRRSRCREGYRYIVKFGDRQALARSVRATYKIMWGFPVFLNILEQVHPLKLSAKTHYRTGNNITVTHVVSRSQSSFNSQSTSIRANIVPSCTQFSISLDHVRTGPVEWLSDLAAIRGAAQTFSFINQIH
jgi:hypothetical protein